MITAEKARERAKMSRSLTIIPLLSEHADSNEELIYKVVNEKMYTAVSGGYFSLQIVITSIFPFDKAINTERIISYFEQYGYRVKFGDVVVNDSVVVGRYTVRLEIGW